MKAEIKTIEREIVTTKKVKEDVINLTLTKKEFAIIQDALYCGMQKGNAGWEAKKRAWEMFAKLQPGGLTSNTWWYDENQDVSDLFRE